MIRYRLDMDITGPERQRRLDNMIHQGHDGSGGDIRRFAADIAALPSA